MAKYEIELLGNLALNFENFREWKTIFVLTPPSPGKNGIICFDASRNDEVNFFDFNDCWRSFEKQWWAGRYDFILFPNSYLLTILWGKG